MKIAMLCSSHFLDDDRVSRKEAVSLAKFGHNVTVFARTRYEYQDDTINLVPIDSGEKAISRSNSLSRVIRFVRLWKLFLETKRLKPDLLIAHEIETALLALLLSKFFKIPYIFDSHECSEETIASMFPSFFNKYTKKLAILVPKIIANNAQAVTVVSQANKDLINKISPETIVDILHNSPILRYFPYNNSNTNRLTIVHEGTLSLERGALQILKALSIVKNRFDFEFLVLGTIPSNIYGPFIQLARDLDLENNLTMPGRLPWTEFGQIEQRGQIGLICSQPIPNHMLSLSNKLYTYMACGLAIVGMKDSETEKILKKYNCGIAVDTTKPERIAEGINYLIENPQIRMNLAKNGRKAIEKHLGWHRMEVRMKRLYSIVEKQISHDN